MKIAFLQETVNRSIGLSYLSAALKSGGHQCELFIQPLEKNFSGAVSSYRPDIIGLSVITGAHRWALAAAGHFKRVLPRVFVAAGGPHPTYFPGVIDEPCLDAVARGEAEFSLLELANRLEKKEDFSGIAGFWVKSKGKVFRNETAPLVEDISSLPGPDHELYLKYGFFRSQSEVPFSATRGCPFRCAFCYNHAKAALYQGKGRYVRARKAQELVREINYARGLYPKMRTVILYDDIIGIDKEWLADFSALYSREVRLPWFASIRADLVDGFVVENLRRANCSCLSLGVETGDEELREAVLGKRIPNSQYIEAARLLRDAGIKIRTSNMLFLPQEDTRKAIKTVDLNRQMRADFPWAYTLQPYPGTAIYDYALSRGCLAPSFTFDQIDPLGLLRPIIKVRDKNKILAVHRLFHFAVRSRAVRGILKALVLFPPNPLFDLAYALGLIISYAQYHQVSFPRALAVAWSNYQMAKRSEAGGLN